jgi:hypothetical protein
VLHLFLEVTLFSTSFTNQVLLMALDLPTSKHSEFLGTTAVQEPFPKADFE